MTAFHHLDRRNGPKGGEISEKHSGEKAFYFILFLNFR